MICGAYSLRGLRSAVDDSTALFPAHACVSLDANGRSFRLLALGAAQCLPLPDSIAQGWAGSDMALLGSAVLESLPSWVAPAEMERALDPLGLQQEADAYAEQLLPGVTVQTERARYLTFLCWGRLHELTDVDVDRWEVATASGEHYRHLDSPGDCSFLGKNKLKSLLGTDFPRRDRVPTRLHQQTARMLYGNLLETTSALDSRGALTRTGERLALWYRPGRRSLPRYFGDCESLPCLNAASATEREVLGRALLTGTAASRVRLATYRAVPVKLWVAPDRALAILRHFLEPSRSRTSDAAKRIHQAAAFELAAYALKRVFLHMYRKVGGLHGRLPAHTRLVGARAFVIREDSFLHDVTAHLRRADALGGTRFLEGHGISSIPRTAADLLEVVAKLHGEAKPEAPWVDADWKVLHSGLGPANVHGIHGYRFPAFGKMLLDLGHTGNRSIEPGLG